MGSVSLRFIVLPVDSLGRMHHRGAFPLLPGWGCGDRVVSCLSNVQAAAVLGGAASMRDNMQMQWGTQL